MLLPYDRELTQPESLLEWVNELGVKLEILEIDGYPSRPLIFSKYQLSGPSIVIYRYLPMEDWLNLMCQQYVGFYGPWYFLHLAHRIYDHLELSGLFELKRSWWQVLFGRLSSTEERAYRFTQQILGTLHSPMRFDEVVERGFRPAAPGKKMVFTP